MELHLFALKRPVICLSTFTIISRSFQSATCMHTYSALRVFDVFPLCVQSPFRPLPLKQTWALWELPLGHFFILPPYQWLQRLPQATTWSWGRWCCSLHQGQYTGTAPGYLHPGWPRVCVAAGQAHAGASLEKSHLSVIVQLYRMPSRDLQRREERLLDYLAHSITILRGKYLECGLLICGDFNKSGVAKITRITDHHFGEPCRKNPLAVRVFCMDIIITTLSQWYQEPEILPPVGTSDHSSVLWRPKARSMINIPPPSATYKRAMPDSAIRSFGRWISSYSWKPVLDATSTQAKADTFYSILEQQIEAHFPSKKCKIINCIWQTLDDDQY